MVYYPMSNGRSIQEFVRVIKALQESDKTGFATPENWQPGDVCIVPPPKTTADAEARMKSEHNVVDWYFSKTKK
jgi:peroxiredoxin (alkyl hydroperoxide reductase subunit C)